MASISSLGVGSGLDLSSILDSLTAALLNGEFTVAGGDRRFRIVSGGARGQGLRLRQMGDADGVFPGDGVTRSGGTERYF